MNARTQVSAWSHGVLEASVLLAVVSVPVFVNYYAFRVFEQSKAALLVSLGLLALLAGGVAWIERGGAAGLRRAVTRPLVAAALLAWLAAAVATVTSIAPATSLLGTLDRAQGLVTLTAALALFLAAAVAARAPAGRERLVAAMVAGSAPVAVFALGQALGVEVVPGRVETAGRVFGTLSNPIFLGAYAMMVLPLTLFLVARAWGDRRLPHAVGLAALALVQVAALGASASRGPALGLVAGLFVLGLAWAALRRARAVGLAIGGLAVGALLLLAALNVPGGPLAAARDLPVVGRLAQISDTTAGSQAVRLRIWQGVWRLAGHQPARLATGYGPETLRYALLPVAEPNMGGRGQADRLVDRAHNQLLDAVAMTGLPGAAALLAVFGAWIVSALGALGLTPQRSDRRLLTALLAVGAAAGLATRLLPAVAVHAGALVLLGMVAGLVAYLFVWLARARDPAAAPLAPDAGLALALLAVGVAVIVEAAFGILTVATQVLFWAQAGVLAALASAAGRAGSEVPVPPERERERERESAAPRRQAGGRLAAGRSERPGGGGEITLSWTPGGGALGLAVGGAMSLLLYAFVVHGQPALPAALPMLLLLLAVTWLAGVLVAGACGESGAAAGLTAALTAVLYAALRWALFLGGGDATALFAVTVAWLLGSSLLAGVWLRPRQAAGPLVVGPAAIAHPVISVIAVAAVVVLAVRPVQADMHFQTAVRAFETAVAADDPALLQAAEASFQRAVAANPREAAYRSRWAELYTVVGASAAADPVSAAAWFDRAQSEASHAEALEPLMPYHVFNRGHLQLTFAQMLPPGQRESFAANAEQALQQAFDRAPFDPRLASELALAKLMQGNATGAIALLEYARDQLDSEDLTTWQLLGAAYATAGRTADAAAAAQRAEALGGASADNYAALGDLARQSGDYKAAVEWYEKALAAGPVSWVVLYNLGLLYRDTGDRDMAMQTLSYAMQRATSEDDRARVQDALQDVLLGTGRMEP